MNVWAMCVRIPKLYSSSTSLTASSDWTLSTLMAERVVQCCKDEVVLCFPGRPVRSGPSVPRVNPAGGAFVSLASRDTRRDMHTAAIT